MLSCKRELRDAQDVGKSTFKGKKFSNHAQIKLLNPETVKLKEARTGMIYFIKKTASNRDKNVHNSQFLNQFRKVHRGDEDPYRLTGEQRGSSASNPITRDSSALRSNT